jgi:hypothetical protein
LSSSDPLLAPTVSITIDDAIGGRQHLSKITSPVVHAAQRELELKVELLVVENFRAISRSSLKSQSAPAPGGLHKVQSSTASDNDQSRMRMGGCRA